jgi:hypothetical protein
VTAAEMMQLEAARSVVLAAVTATQGALQTIEAMILTHDRTDPAPNENSWGAFEDPSKPPTTTEAANGKARRKKGA